MNNLSNASAKIKQEEKYKARMMILILTLVYAPLLTYNYLLINSDFTSRIEELGKYKYFSGIFIRIAIICLIAVAIQKIINIKLKVRDVLELKFDLLVSFVIFIVGFIVTLEIREIDIYEYSFYIASYLATCCLILYVSLTEYSTSKMGIYNEEVEDFVHYSTERKFIFKLDLRDSELVDSEAPLEDLNSIVKKQCKELPYANDLDNAGKYYSYLVQSYIKDDIVFVTIGFSNTGKELNKIITLKGKYSLAEFQEHLDTLNDNINIYLKK